MNGFTSKISTVFPGLSGDANTKKVRKVEARIVTWELDHGGTEVVGHCGSFLVGGQVAGPTQQTEDTPASERDLLRDSVGRYFGIRRARRGARRVLRPP
jgi:hypothetical protein